MRINKFLARYAGMSRRAADELIDGGKVRMNGRRAVLGDQVDEGKDQIEVNGRIINEAQNSNDLVCYAVNKPAGVVSTTQDEWGRKTVVGLLPKQVQRVYPIGRLDVDSQGLLLLTNDGELTQALTHPSHQVAKVYEVLVRGALSSKSLQSLRNGVPLKDGRTAPADIEVIEHDQGDTWLQMTLREGRNRQIRRMLKHFNYEVVKLIRVQIGEFHLEELEGRQWVQLNQEQLDRCMMRGNEVER